VTEQDTTTTKLLRRARLIRMPFRVASEAARGRSDQGSVPVLRCLGKKGKMGSEQTLAMNNGMEQLKRPETVKTTNPICISQEPGTFIHV
jgi:hypothetical protein